MPEGELQPMRLGYARVSTRDQNLEMQLDALNKAGCKRVFTDKLSGAQLERPGLKEALSHLREADTLVVWKLDRLGIAVTVFWIDREGKSATVIPPPYPGCRDVPPEHLFPDLESLLIERFGLPVLTHMIVEKRQVRDRVMQEGATRTCDPGSGAGGRRRWRRS